MRTSRTIAAACALFVLTGCQAAERFRNNMTRRLQSAAVCSLLSITGSVDAEPAEPAATSAPLQVKRGKAVPEVAAPKQQRAAVVRKTPVEGGGLTQVVPDASRKATRDATWHRVAYPTTASLVDARSASLLTPERAKAIVLDAQKIEKHFKARSAKRFVLKVDPMVALGAAEPVESIVIGTESLEILPPTPSPCRESHGIEAAPASLPVAEVGGGSASVCGPARAWPCGEAAPQR
jgi:hypothetical protein